MSDWTDAISNLQEVCRDTFGIPVSYIPCVKKRPSLGGAAIEVTGIFDDKRETVNVTPGRSGIHAVTPKSVVEIRLVDLGIDPMVKDEVVVDGVTYKIVDIHLDGHGTAILSLHQNRDPFA